MGVADKPGGPEAFSDCDLDAATVQRRVHELTEPPLMVAARTERHYGVSLLIVDVLRSFELHADKQGRATRRIGTSCVPILPQEHQRMREERMGVELVEQAFVTNCISRSFECPLVNVARTTSRRQAS